MLKMPFLGKMRGTASLLAVGPNPTLGTPLELELAPYTRYFYRVTVTSDAREMARSEVYYFETVKPVPHCVPLSFDGFPLSRMDRPEPVRDVHPLRFGILSQLMDTKGITRLPRREITP